MREERSRVAVAAHAEQYQIEFRKFRVRVELEKYRDGRPVQRGGPFGVVFLGPPAKDVFPGDAERLEEILRRHPVISLIVVGRHAALVAEKEKTSRPVDSLFEIGRGQQAVERFRRRAAGQRGREPAALRPDRVRRDLDELFGREMI